MNRPFIACNHGVQSILDAITWFGQVYCTQQTGVLTRGMTLRAIQATEVIAGEPGWMPPFLASLAKDDLSPATLRGYRYDLRHFLAWRRTVQDSAFAIDGLAEYELIAYRQHMVAAGRRPATVNRRLDALRRLCRWARGTGVLAADAARDVRPMRTVRNQQPAGLTDIEVHALLRSAGASSHGLAARNYAIVQLMLQAGLRVGEVAALRMADVTMSDRSGSVRIRHGKGLKAREIPLNATARRALRQFLEERPTPGEAKDAALFVSSRNTAMPVRTIQAVISSLARRARLKRVAVSAHTLRHTFALGYLRDNPGKLVELASLLGHDSLDTTAIYTRPSRDDLAADLEHSHLNVDG
jgi:site-specific recombinase XerD